MFSIPKVLQKEPVQLVIRKLERKAADKVQPPLGFICGELAGSV